MDTMRIVGVVYKALEALLDAILPPRARATRTKERTIEEIPLSPTSHELLGAKITTLMEYHNPAVQDLIRSLKYDGSGYAAQLAAVVLADYLREEISSAKAFSTKKLLIVPVPLHKNRNRERGFNQIELVLKALPPEFRDGTLATFAPHSLVRTRETKQQTRLSRTERLRNVTDAFAVPDAEVIKKSHVFLIDDVTTTGATLVQAARPLHAAGAETTLLALARA
jgi:ComF family protein